MPSTSPAQQRLFGPAYAIKTGKLKKEYKMKHIQTFENFLNESKGQYKIDDYSLKVLSKYFKKMKLQLFGMNYATRLKNSVQNL
jgi:hypothetical protein